MVSCLRLKILARDVVNQSDRDVICVTHKKGEEQAMGVPLIDAKSVILQMSSRVLTGSKNIYVCC